MAEHKKDEVVKREVASDLHKNMKEEHEKAGAPYGDTDEGADEWANQRMGNSGLSNIDNDLDTNRFPLPGD